jgi:diguanylate cyclase (GGDEF)-like protein
MSRIPSTSALRYGRLGRLAAVGLAAVLLLAAATALLTARSTGQATSEMRTRLFAAQQFEAGSDLLHREQALLIRILTERSPAAWQGFQAVQREVAAMRRVVMQDSDAAQLAQAKQLFALHDRMVVQVAAVYRESDPQRYKTEADSALQLIEVIQTQMEEADDEELEQTARTLDQMARTERLSLWGALTVVAVGSVLAALLALSVRFWRRRAEDAINSQLEALQRQALTDSLTGLANRRAFHDDLIDSIAEAQRHDEPLTLMFVDLVGLKGTNDEHGLDAGDKRIRALADALHDALPRGGAAYRLGGDELSAVLPRCSADDALAIVHRLSAQPREHGRISVGITSHWPGRDKAALVRDAGLALAASKQRGGCPVVNGKARSAA